MLPLLSSGRSRRLCCSFRSNTGSQLSPLAQKKPGTPWEMGSPYWFQSVVPGMAFSKTQVGPFRIPGLFKTLCQAGHCQASRTAAAHSLPPARSERGPKLEEIGKRSLPSGVRCELHMVVVVVAVVMEAVNIIFLDNGLLQLLLLALPRLLPESSPPSPPPPPPQLMPLAAVATCCSCVDAAVSAAAALAAVFGQLGMFCVLIASEASMSLTTTLYCMPVNGNLRL